jgi:predicted DNA-binding mobile mystery protein A
LKRLEPLKTGTPPRKGWIRAVREALGMTGEQLGKRLQVNKQRVSRIEQDETLGNVTLKTLRQVAEALECTLVYGFVPNDSLEQTVRHQAKVLAQKRFARSHHMMRLEKQELSHEEKEKAYQDLVRDILETMPRSLWDEL